MSALQKTSISGLSEALILKVGGKVVDAEFEEITPGSYVLKYNEAASE